MHFFYSRASCGFVCHCSHVIVFKIKCPLWSGWGLCQKNSILRLIDALRTGVGKPAFFDSKSARIARTPCTRPRPGKPTRGLSQCKRACGHGNSGSVSQCGLRGGGGGELSDTFWIQKKWELKQFCERKKTTVTFDIAGVKIGVDMKFEKGLNWGYRDTFPALLMAPSHHFLEN